MQKFCTSCGTEIPDGAASCPNCGLAVPETVEVTTPPKKKIKWWIPVIAVVLVAAIAVALLLPMLTRSPEAMVATAAANTGEELSKRYEGHPLTVFNGLDGLSDAGTLHINGVFSSEYYGDMDLRLAFKSDLVNAARELELIYGLEMKTAYGKMSNEIDFSFYYDREYAALSSDTLMQGKALGITYDTFSEDLRGNTLFANMDEVDLLVLESFVDALEQSFEVDEAAAEEFNDQLATEIMKITENLELVTGKEKITLGQKDVNCDTVSVSMTQEEIAQCLEAYVNLMESNEALRGQFMASASVGNIDGSDPEEHWNTYVSTMRDTIAQLRNEYKVDVTYTVVIYNDRMVQLKMKLDMTAPEDEITTTMDMTIHFGENAATDDLILDMDVAVDGENVNFYLTDHVVNDAANYQEDIDLTMTSWKNETIAVGFDYAWTKSGGDLQLGGFLTDEDGQTRSFDYTANLQAGETSVVLTLPNLHEALFADLDEVYGEIYDLSVAITLEEGAVVEKPEFLNIDKWTEEELMSIMGY